MSIVSTIAGLLRAPVGNNLANKPEDVENTKRNFAAIGRYKKPINNGIYDQDLDDAIYAHQRDNNLKIDAIMNPGGETEASMISTALKLPKKELSKEEKKTGIQQVNAAIFPLMGLTLGMSAPAVMQWWQNEANTKQRENMVRSLEKKLQNSASDPDPMQHCEDNYERNLIRCEAVARQRGKDAGRICNETAFTQYSQCLAGKSENDWRKLQDR